MLGGFGEWNVAELVGEFGLDGRHGEVNAGFLGRKAWFERLHEKMFRILLDCARNPCLCHVPELPA